MNKEGDRIAVYAGSFDPPTNGHIHILNQALRAFDVVHVLIATNADKKRAPLLTAEERASVFDWFGDNGWATGSSMAGMPGPNIEVAILDPKDYTVQYARQVGAEFLIRGLRDGMDFEYERKLQFAQARIARVLGIPEPTTWYIGSPLNDELYTSSTLVRGFMDMDNWRNIVFEFVPSPTMELLERKYGNVNRA